MQVRIGHAAIRRKTGPPLPRSLSSSPLRRAAIMFASRIALFPLIAASLAACTKEGRPNGDARPVRAVAIERRAEGEIVSLTGQVRARDEVNLAFRLDGDECSSDPSTWATRSPPGGSSPGWIRRSSGTRSPHANLQSVQAVMTQARLAFSRQQQLFKDGWTARAKFDEAQQTLLNAEGQVELARAEMRTAGGAAKLYDLVRRCVRRRHRRRRRARRGRSRRADGRAGRARRRTRRRLRRSPRSSSSPPR